MCASNQGSPPAGDLARLGGVEEANVLAQQGVKEASAYPEVEAGHAQSKEAAPHSCEDCTPKSHPNQLQGCLLEHLAVWFYGCIVYDFAGKVGDQSLAQSCNSACGHDKCCYKLN